MTMCPRFFMMYYLLAMAACLQASSLWPVVRSLHEVRTYTIIDESDTPLMIVLKTPSGVSVYKLECHNGNYEDMSFINFSGDFQCVLFSIEGDRRTSWNLLASDDRNEQRSDFFNRARMTSNQIWGDCGKISEYGRVRRFRLRGMRITFEFKDLKWTSSAAAQQPRLTGFTFVLDVLLDANAISASAEKVQAPWPGSPCK